MKNQNNSNQGKEKSLNQPADSRIAAVRDLIFGENMQQYDQDFTEVSSQISELKKETDKNIASLITNIEERDKNNTDLSTKLQTSLQSLQKSTEASLEKLIVDIDKRFERLDEAKADRKKLGKALEKIALMLQG